MQKASDAAFKFRNSDDEKAARLLSCAVLGPDQLVASTTLEEADHAQRRLEDVKATGDSLAHA